MRFLILHVRNNFCSIDPIMVNSEHILNVTPIRGYKKWSLDATGSRVGLTTGATLYVTESWESIMGMLREAQGGESLPGAGPMELMIRQ